MQGWGCLPHILALGQTLKFCCPPCGASNPLPGCCSPWGAPRGSGEVGALQGLPCAIGWHFVTPCHRTRKALPTRGRKAEL